MEIIKKAEITAEQYVSQVLDKGGCDDGGHCKYCINGSNYSN